MLLKAFDCEERIIVGIVQAIVQFNLVGLAVVNDHLVILAKYLVVLLLLANGDLLSIRECV